MFQDWFTMVLFIQLCFMESYFRVIQQKEKGYSVNGSEYIQSLLSLRRICRNFYKPHTYIADILEANKTCMYQILTQIVNQKDIYYIQIKLPIHQILRLVEMIQRAQSQPLRVHSRFFPSTVKGVLLQFIRNVHDFWRFTSIHKKCTRFLVSVATYMRSALLYSTLRNITVESRHQKRTFSSTKLWWCRIVTFSQNRVTNGCSTCLTTRMVLYL